jgi:hypothetical protein
MPKDTKKEGGNQGDNKENSKHLYPNPKQKSNSKELKFKTV